MTRDSISQGIEINDDDDDDDDDDEDKCVEICVESVLTNHMQDLETTEPNTMNNNYFPTIEKQLLCLFCLKTHPEALWRVYLKEI